MKIDIDGIVDVGMLKDIFNVVGVPVGVHFEWVELRHGVDSGTVPDIDGVEGVLVEVHFGGVLLQQSDQFENLTATGAPLERAFLQHKEHEFVLLVVVLVLETSAANVPEGSISCENDNWVVDCSELDSREVLEVLEHLQIEGVLTVVGMPECS